MKLVTLMMCIWLGIVKCQEKDEGPVIITRPRNTTVAVGTEATFRCRARGVPDPTYTWQKYPGVDLGRTSSRYRYTRGGTRLYFRRTAFMDVGLYRCKVTDSLGRISYTEYASLQIEAPATMVQGPENRVVYYGTTVNLQCKAIGFPQPQIIWEKDGVPILDEDTGQTFGGTTLIINATATATYKCEASNKYAGKISQVIKEGKIEVVAREQTSYCASYNGSICTPYIGRRMVYLNSSLDHPMHTNEQIVNGLWVELISKLSRKCRAPAENLLCHYAFPNCDMTKPEKPNLLCKEDCQAVRDLFCFQEWLEILENKKDGIFFKNRGHFRLPDCDRLPSWRNETCSKINFFKVDDNLASSKCYIGKGQFYNGTVNITKSGIPCQHWSSQVPHAHKRLPSTYPPLENAENYCRNVGAEWDRPWCYTTDKHLRWEVCNIPACEENGSISSLDHYPSGVSIPVKTIYIIGGTVGAGIFLLVIVVVVYHHKNQANNQKYLKTPNDDFELDLEKLPSNESYHRRSPSALLNPKLEALEYPRNDIVYMRDIGQGAFGRVFQARVPHIIKGEDSSVVAVKMLKDDAAEEMQRYFEREASLMVEFNHRNIVRLLGVCAIGKPMCLIFEYMSKGDLNEFLRLCSPDHFIVRRRSNELLANDSPKIDHIEQLDMARQIASGMVYLSSRGYVHRDLATRNCLVTDQLVVKIADFGLARTVHQGLCYKGDDDDPIPVRWMPLESILFNKFTSESDVWSFGVVVWEIFSFALQPYYGMTHVEVVRYIKDGKILSCPDNTPQEVYDIMRLCWNCKPSSRPSFSNLYKSLGLIQKNLINIKKRAERS